jgi:hypothetical protein
MIADLDSPLALVAHDAGAANHMLAWLRDAGPVRLAPSLGGPALALWQREYGAAPLAGLEGALEGARTLLSGTGWASDLEHEARRLARRKGVRSIAVLDHWTNYRARFERGGETILPDEIWVSDEHALALANAAFPTVRVVRQPNAYLAGLVREVAGLPRAAAAPGRPRLLYVLEPIRDAWGEREQPGEFAALDFFIEHLDRLGLDGKPELRLRPHPSDPPGKYAAWIARQGGGRVALDPAPTLAAALAWADVVAGCQTYAMVVALAAGRRVVCSIPPWAPACVLPHAGIVALSALPPWTQGAINE